MTLQFLLSLGETDELVGTPPKPEVDIPTNIIHVFVENIIDPGQPFATTVSPPIISHPTLQNFNRVCCISTFSFSMQNLQ